MQISIRDAAVNRSAILRTPLYRTGRALLCLSGIALIFGSIVPLGMLTVNSTCNFVCYGSYSPTWLGLGNDPQAPQLGDWASGQGLVFIGLGFLLLALATSMYNNPRMSRDLTRPIASLSVATAFVGVLFLAPLAIRSGPDVWTYNTVILALMTVLAVLWGRRVLNRAPARFILFGEAGAASAAIVASALSWLSLGHFLNVWVTPHNDGWQVFMYSWHAAVVPFGCALAATGVALLGGDSARQRDRT